MTFKQFKDLVLSRGWSLAELRCDVPPSPDILDLIEQIGLKRYEAYVRRLS